MRKRFISALYVAGALLFYHSAWGQEGKSVWQRFDPILTVFTNFHSGLAEAGDDRGFALERCYLGFRYAITDDLSFRGAIDIGQFPKEEDNQRFAFLKYAEIQWKLGRMKLNAGMISTTMFKVQEYFWDKRYLMKSFQDEYDFGSSADLGISVAYDFDDRLSADFIFANGEGYKKLQINNGLLYGLGVTYRPIDQLTLRVYGELNEGGEDGERTSKVLALFGGYKNEHFSLAAEYARQFNYDHLQGRDVYGTSVYGSWYIDKRWEIFARYDKLMSNHGWQATEDGQRIVCGLQWKIGKYIRLAPNFRCTIPDARSDATLWYGYLNCIFSL